MISRFLKTIKVSTVQFCKQVKHLRILLSILFILSTLACQNRAKVNSVEEGTKLEVIFHAGGLPDVVFGNTLQTVDYQWEFLRSDQPLSNLRVKVHFVNEDNRILFQDDHALPTDRLVQSYSRMLLIPLIPRPQKIKMMVGLYKSDSSEPLYIPDKTGKFLNKIEVLAFRVDPPRYVDDLPDARITYGEGWYQKEFSPDQTDSWRWISNEARCLLKGADRDLTLYIHGWIPPNVFDENISLSLALGGENLGTYTDLSGDFIIKMDITENQIRPNETEELVIRASQSFQPSAIEGSDDTRILSAMIRQFYFN